MPSAHLLDPHRRPRTPPARNGCSPSCPPGASWTRCSSSREGASGRSSSPTTTRTRTAWPRRWPWPSSSRARAGVEAHVAYGGIIGRSENLALVKVLQLPVVPVSQVVFDEYDLLGLVDTQPPVGNHSVPARYPVDVVLDHHPLRDESLAAPFADVGGDYGATSTMVVEYLRAARLEPSIEVATALFYGIKTDSRDLGRQTTPARRRRLPLALPAGGQAPARAHRAPRPAGRVLPAVPPGHRAGELYGDDGGDGGLGRGLHAGHGGRGGRAAHASSRG